MKNFDKIASVGGAPPRGPCKCRQLSLQNIYPDFAKNASKFFKAFEKQLFFQKNRKILRENSDFH